MTPASDYPDEMATPHLIDDASAEALLAGRPVPADLVPVAAVVQALRAATDRPVPPSAELAARMAAGSFPGPGEDYQASVQRPQGRGLVAAASACLHALVAAPRMVRRANLAAKLIAAAAVVAFVGFGGVGFAGALPEPVQHRFEGVVETVTPYEFPGRTGGADVGRQDDDGAGTDDPDAPGSTEAPGQSDQRRPTELPATPPDPGGPPSELPEPATGPDDNPGDRPTAHPGQGNDRRPTAPPGRPATPGAPGQGPPGEAP